MRISYILLMVVVLSLGFFATAKPASAVMWSFTENLGELTAGSSGQFCIGLPCGSPGVTSQVKSSIRLLLPPNTAVTFTYGSPYSSITPERGGEVYAFGRYYYPNGTFSYAFGFSSGASAQDPNGLAIVSAHINENGIGTTTIINRSTYLLDGMSQVRTPWGYHYAHATGDGMEITYEVSSVPLPAALPMFGLALIALRRFFAKKKSAIAAT